MKKRGFTIIEVVLVLAIGGLIFLMVFVALPALQRSQRNTQRRNDLDRVFSAVIDYQSNNKGKLPTEDLGGDILISNYLDNDAVIGYQNVYALTQLESCSEAFMDPDGECYSLYICSLGDTSMMPRGVYCDIDGSIQTVANGGVKYLPRYSIMMFHKTKCGLGEGKWEYVDKGNSFALFYVLEGGQIVCLDNS